MSARDSRVLVTGGAGYLGSVLIPELLRRGYRVRVLDNLLYGIEPIKDLLGNPNFELVEEDIRDMRAIVKCMKDVDTVIHLASIVGNQASNLDPRTTMEINYLAARNLAELGQLYDVKKFIFASTCTVYGAQPERLLTERSPVKPIDLYGETKLLSEKAIYEAFSYPVILRLATLFGMSKRMRFDLAINLFAAQALNKEKLTVFGGKQYRPFLHVADAAQAFIHALEKDLAGIYNVVWENVKIEDVAAIVQKHIPVEVEHSDKIIDRRDYLVSGEKLKKEGFSAKKDIEYTLKEIRAAFESGEIKNYKDPIYSNYKALFESEEAQSKVYTQGPIFR